MKAVITRVTHGKRKGEFRFKFIGDNGEQIGGSGTETYTQKHNAIEVLEKYFPNFPIIDKS